MSGATVTVIVPVRNEAGSLATTLTMLRDALQDGDELVVVDGGSTDASVEIARGLADRVVLCEPGRALGPCCCPGRSKLVPGQPARGP
ncbi:MAG: glycosyltransferase [Alcanivorax sp.]